jgi:hypothetical protein
LQKEFEPIAKGPAVFKEAWQVALHEKDGSGRQRRLMLGHPYFISLG